MSPPNERCGRRAPCPALMAGCLAAMVIATKPNAIDGPSPYPLEYMLDIDYVHDASNPLDVWPKPITTIFIVTTTSTTTTQYTTTTVTTPSTTWTGPKTLPPTTTTTLSTTTTTMRLVSGDFQFLPEGPAVLASCVTVQTPSDYTLTASAPPGTRCEFGVDPRDEGWHCIKDEDTRDVANNGVHGWCWTNSQRDAWGSCASTCPLWGQDKVLEERIAYAESMVRSWKAMLVREHHNMTTTTGAPTTPPPPVTALGGRRRRRRTETALTKMSSVSPADAFVAAPAQADTGIAAASVAAPPRVEDVAAQAIISAAQTTPHNVLEDALRELAKESLVGEQVNRHDQPGLAALLQTVGEEANAEHLA